MKKEFTLDELTKLKCLAVKAQDFELACKCRELERAHPNFKPEEKTTTKGLEWYVVPTFIPDIYDLYENAPTKKKLKRIITKKKPSGKSVTIKKKK